MHLNTDRVVVYVPVLGHTTGEMPHVRKPPVNYMPGQAIYYLYTAVKNLGYSVRVIDANWSIDPIGSLLDYKPSKVLITTATPTFEDTRKTIATLRARGYRGELFVGGPHVSLNWGQRDWLLPPLEGAVYVPLIGSRSTFDWIPTVFPGRTQFEVLGFPDGEARQFLRDSFHAETGEPAMEAKLESLIFSYFVSSIEWMDGAYTGGEIQPAMQNVPLRYSTITSIGCSKTCSFCGNPYIYRIGFKRKETVRKILRQYKQLGIDRVSVADMFFVMYMPHTQDMMDVFREEGMAYSMQTCLENLTDELMVQLKQSGLQKMLVGVENPVSYSVGKRVEIAKVRWLLDQVRELELAGAKLSYIVGLPGVDLGTDVSLIDHISHEVLVRNHPLQDLQVNLYTPYRPEGDTNYYPFTGQFSPVSGNRSLRIITNAAQDVYILNQIPFSYWGSFPVGISTERDLWRQMVLCDMVYDKIYSPFLSQYLSVREQYVEDVRRIYPMLAPHIPTLDESRNIYRSTNRTQTLETAIGNDEGRGRRVDYAQGEGEPTPALAASA